MENDFLGDILESAPDFSPTSKSPAQGAASELQYFRRIGTEEVGPYELAELQELISEGKLQETDRVRRSDSLCWLPCQELAELEFHSNGEQDSELEAASSLLDELLADADDSPVASESASELPELSEPEAADAESAKPVGSPDLDAPRFDLSGLDSEDVDLDAADIDLSDLDSPELDLSDLDSPNLEIPGLDIPDLDMSELDTPEVSPAAERKFDATPKMPPPKPEPPVRAKYEPVPAKSDSKPSRKPLPIPMWSEEDEAAAASHEAKRRSGGIQLEMPSSALLYVLGAVLIVAAVVYLRPASNSGVQGQVSIDGTPLTVGTVSLSSTASDGKAMSLNVIDGKFGSAQSLPDGGYKAIVVVGNPLGMEVPQLENTPFKKLNGARFELTMQVDSANPDLKVELSSKQAVLLKSPGGSGVNAGASNRSRKPRR